MIYRFFHTGFDCWYFSEDGVDWYAEEKTQGKPSRDRKALRENKRSA